MRKTESILVATDLGDTSDVVVRAAAGLASSLHAKLHLLHALDLDMAPYPASGEKSSFAALHDAAERALDEQIARTVPPDVEIASRSVQTFLAHRAILETASGFEVDLIVMGSHGGHSLVDAFLGTTVDHVIRTADVPCLVVRGPLALPLRHLIVPVDMSETARAALEVALAWATALRAGHDDGASAPRVTAVHVVPTTFRVDGFPFDREVIAPELHREVQAAVTRPAAGGAPEVREVVQWGDDPTEEIVRMVEAERPELVVMATHGHGALRRALVGSVAVGIARRAACPVLLVPPPLWNAKTTPSDRDR